MFLKALEHFKCDVLTRGPCRMRPNFASFDHQMKVKVAEIFSRGLTPPGHHLALPPPLEGPLGRKNVTFERP